MSQSLLPTSSSKFFARIENQIASTPRITQPNLPPLPSLTFTKPPPYPPPLHNPIPQHEQIQHLMGKSPSYIDTHYCIHGHRDVENISTDTPIAPTENLAGDTPRYEELREPPPASNPADQASHGETHTDITRILCIQRIMETRSPTMHAPAFRFAWSHEAAVHNWEILAQFDLDIQRAITSQARSPLSIGSEFRDLHLLQPLLSYHPLWSRFAMLLTKGVEFPLLPLTEEQRLTDLALAMSRGNHSSAKSKSDVVKKLLIKEVERGWQLPLPPEKIHLLPNAVVAPMGIVTQATINKHGEIIPKDRLTHDQSFEFSKGTSVNARVIFDRLTPCRYGTALRRFIHYIVELRQINPDTRILMTKLDIKAAYRRLHTSGTTASQAIVIIDDVALLALCMTFGGAPNPSMWSDVSEIACDTCNLITRDTSWNPDSTPTLESPHQHKYVRKPCYLRSKSPCQPALPTLISTYPNLEPFTDCYLDDLFTCFLDLPTPIWKGSRITLLTLHLLGRPIADTEPLQRDDLLAFDKMLAEGSPEESKIILGWEVNTRTLRLRLPQEKLKSWNAEIDRILQLHSVDCEILATTIGRLNHASYVIPTARAFLCHLRRAERRARASGKSVILNELQTDELRQWIGFLRSARRGISLNRLTLRVPTILLRADACQHGIGGFSLTTGQAWRWEIPMADRGKLSLNLLEYLASITTIAMEAAAGNIQPDACILSQLDSSTADYWLHRGGARFQGHEKSTHLAISRWLADILDTTQACSFSHWIPGEDNIIADSLSRDHHLSPLQLTHLLQSSAAHQIPPNFDISPIPTEIASRLTLWTQRERAPKGFKLIPKRSTLASSAFGKNSWAPSDSALPLTLSLSTSPRNTAPDSSEPSRTPSGKPSSAHIETLLWHRQQSAIPSHLFRRPLWSMTDPTPLSTYTAKLTEFYASSCRPTDIPIQPSNTSGR